MSDPVQPELSSSSARPGHLLEQALDADRAIWQTHRPGAIAARDRAVQAAIAAGWTPVEIAERLQVRPGDVQRWAEQGPASEGRPSGPRHPLG